MCCWEFHFISFRIQVARRCLASQRQKPVEDAGDDVVGHFPADSDEFIASEVDVDSKARYNFE